MYIFSHFMIPRKLFDSQEIDCTIFQILYLPELKDLPPLPETRILLELITLYFEKVAYIKSIIHPQKFIRDCKKYFEFKIPATKLPPQLQCMLANPISPALLLSMLTLGAAHHPMYKDNSQLIKDIFYQRSRKLALKVSCISCRKWKK